MNTDPLVRWGSYQSLYGLGRGGMADVHLARDARDELVILKCLRSPATERRVTMFEDEARLGLLLDHPNVVRTVAAGESDGNHCIVMEFLDGQSLDRLLRRGAAKASPDELRAVLLFAVAESLAGLHHAHELDIVHRDFTPENLFVTYDGAVKVLDFGIAKHAAGLARTSTGEIKGKVRYMAPEQALGLRADRRADIFSAGVMLWEIASGETFWRQEMSDREVFDDLIGATYPTEVPNGRPTLNAIARRALARDASERYRSADEMRAHLLAAIGETNDLATLPERASKLLCELFASERARTKRMVERARAADVEKETREGGSGSRSRLLFCGLALVLAGLTPARALADEATDKSAQEHFQRGVKLTDDGDYKLALVEFQRSYELVPNHRVLYNIGEVEFQLNAYANAMRTLSKYLVLGGPRITEQRRSEVERDLEALKIRTAQLRVDVDVAGADILVDGERIGRSPLADRELVDAGPHRVSAQKQGFVTALEPVTLAGGDDRTIVLHLLPVPKQEPLTVMNMSDQHGGLGPVWIGWGLTVALAVATVGLGVGWQNADSKLSDLKGTESSETERRDQARSVDTLRTTTFVLGGATLAAAGVSLFFTLRRGSETPSASKVGLGLGVGRVALDGTF